MQLSGQNKCIQCAKIVVKNEGIMALYRSLPITLLMNAPYHTSTVIINENMKKIIEPKKRKFKFLSYLLCAGIAGAISSFITCPLDNIKTRLQTQSTKSSCEVKFCESDRKKLKEEDSNLVKYKNIKQTILSIYKSEGIWKGFYRGVWARMLFNSPSCAISWSSYEFMKYFLGSK